jgi:hypothetical protein
MKQGSLFGLPETPCLPSKKDKQGQKAVKSGQTAEATIYCILKERGYGVERQYLIGQSLYGGELRADFYVTRIPQFPTGLFIESKWQHSSGSVDEKYPYLIANIKQCYPCPTIIVCAGGGARPLAVEWLRKQADGNKLYAVFSLEEFLTWIIRNL